MSKKLSEDESFKYGRFNIRKQKIILYYFKRLGYDVFAAEFKRLFDDGRLSPADLEAIKYALKEKIGDDA